MPVAHRQGPCDRRADTAPDAQAAADGWTASDRRCQAGLQASDRMTVSGTSPPPSSLPLTRLGWAWEFLRRNPRYQRLYAEFQVPLHGRKPSIGMANFRRWGVIFRGGPRAAGA
jgi:hypothetical protein